MQGLYLFSLSLLCLPYKCRNEHYIWNIFKGTLWWFTVLHLCKHFVFSPAGNQLPLLDLLSLFLSECSCFLCHRAEMGAFESICFTLIYFLQSHITPGLILTAFCKQLLPLLGATVFSSCSLSEESGFSHENCTWFLKWQKGCICNRRRRSKRLCGTMPVSDSGCRTTLRSLRAGWAQGGTSPGHLYGSGLPNPHCCVYQPTAAIYSLAVSWTHLEFYLQKHPVEMAFQVMDYLEKYFLCKACSLIVSFGTSMFLSYDI